MIISRGKALVLFGLIFIIYLLSTRSPFVTYRSAYGQLSKVPPSADYSDNKFRWANVPQKFPVTSMRTVPTSISKSIPRIQHDFGKEPATERKVRIARLNAVKGNFTHAWKGYKDHAWLRDEVMPLSGGSHDPFGGWAATLVDSLGS
jgi:mannosyl-oligosaccharide alpha-1,2-mannosidase